mgnify:CR=1 FL=1
MGASQSTTILAKQKTKQLKLHPWTCQMSKESKVCGRDFDTFANLKGKNVTVDIPMFYLQNKFQHFIP